MIPEKKGILLQIHPEIKKTLKPIDTNQWIQTQIQQYQPQLTMPPIPYYKRVNYQPVLTFKTLKQLKKAPGNSYSQKITNLYFNKITRENKKEQRESILKKFFPHNKHI